MLIMSPVLSNLSIYQHLGHSDITQDVMPGPITMSKPDETISSKKRKLFDVVSTTLQGIISLASKIVDHLHYKKMLIDFHIPFNL